MATTRDASPTGLDDPDSGVIDLEPTLLLETSSPSGSVTTPGRVGVAEGTVASLAAETSELRRGRVGAAAIFLTATYAILSLWCLYTLDNHVGLVLVLMLARLALAGAIAWACLSAVALTPARLKGLEYTLFGGMTALLLVSQYYVNFHLLRQGDVVRAVACIKNGVFQTFALMILYGTFIPNNPRATARVVLSMALAVVLTLTFLMEHSELAEVVRQLRTSEQAGSNALVLMLGAGLSVYGAYVLNGLRAELHEARKFGQYRLLESLGAGGMGAVYLAEHTLLKRPCALKLIKPEAGANPLALARFEREVRSTARLSHPNTIEIFDYGHTADGTFYYVMEYLQGLSLSELVRRDGPLPPGRVIYLLRQVCAGLSEAHALGMVHRDLKPANIYVAQRGGEFDVAKVLDFGLVKVTHQLDSSDLTRDQTVSGTPLYMAPEQAMGDRTLDGRADLYALGAIAYFMLTGHPPFSGETPFAVMMAQARDPVVPPTTLRPEIPADLERVVLRCLAKSPADRYPDARALSKALLACTSAAEWDADKAEALWSAQGGRGAVFPG